ncbi:MAG TPA: ABC transporter permease [Nitrososphaeraceae archaeon]|nr:ABC transporter permease [Nitrososphaeraceae archaeon]
MSINQILINTLKNNFLNIYAIWLREFKVYLRERSRLVASLFTPLLWLFIVGSGLGSTTTLSIDVNYQQFIFPGIISMSIIFTSVFYGAYIIWDRKFDFLKSVMVAPVSREIIFIGKTFGGMTNSLIQVFMLLIIGFFIGIDYTLISLVQIIFVSITLSFLLTALGLGLGSNMQSLEGFQMIVSFVVFPLFFLSGALFPLDNLPDWLSFLTIIDPAAYAVDALRNSILGIATYSFELDLLLLFCATIVTTFFGILSFRKMRAV